MTPSRWQQVEELYHAALECDAGERAALLARADPELRREVESLLAQQSGATPLDRPAWEGAASLLGSTVAVLSPGTQLGPYKIEGPLGSGGMGDVFRAVDTRLGRAVAIKTSQEQFSARFDREARAISSLNHPHICTLHDVGPNYLVMELCEGETLAARLKRGKLSIQETLRYGAQIADALAAAHAKGITHRDLKPGNIMISKSGVKVLDFGLAKSQEDLTLTGTRMVMGTPAYMAPEQREGKECDARTDIYSLGLVFYEMATGKRVDQGQKEHLPEKLTHVLDRCLEQDPAERWQTASDVRRELQWAATSAPEPGVARRPWLAWSVAAVLVVTTAAALWAPWRAEKPVDRSLTRLDVDLGADVSMPAPDLRLSSIAVSPDGTRLVYRSGTPVKLFTRRLDQSKSTELPGTEGAMGPFFSPDGQWIGFVAANGRNALNKISVEGGAVVTLGATPWATFHGANWGEDGSIFVSDYRGLLRFPASGGAPETLAELGSGESTFDLPQILPGGKAILFAAHSAPDVDKFTIEVLTLADRRRKIVARGGQSPRYLPTSGGNGFLVYVNKAALFAIPFDLDKLETRGTAQPILDDVAYDASSGIGQFDFSRTGTFVYRRTGGSGAGMMTVQWVDPTGRKEPLLAKPGVYNYPSISPDGKRVALRITEGGSEDIWVYDTQRDAMTRLTFGGALYDYIRWSPDGKYVVFGVRGKGIFQARADGTSQPQALTQSKTLQFPWSFMPDGKRMAYDDLGVGNWQMWTVPVEDQGSELKAGKPEQLKSNFYDGNPWFSPDGRWLAFESNESGKNEVYVRAFPPPSSGQGGKWQISDGQIALSGPIWPHWSRNGHELVYRAGDQIMAVSYAVKGDTFVAEKPRVWIPKLGGALWDLAPDGKRVAVLTRVESAEAPEPEHEVVFLESFLDELQRKVPVGK
jgi:serine/threonine protein kinase